MNNLFKKFMEYALGNAIVLLLGFISVPIFTRVVNPVDTGKFSMFMTVTSLMLLVVSFGLDQSYGRYYYDEDIDSRGKLLRKSIELPMIINIIMIPILIIFYKSISMYIVEEESFLVVLLIIVHMICSTITRFSLMQIRMKQKAKLYSLLNVLLKVSNIIFLGVFFYIYRDNYRTLILAAVAANILIAIISVYVERKEWFAIKEDVELKTSTKELLSFGMPLVFAMSITWMFQYIDRIAIKEYAGYVQVGIYSGAMSIIAILNACQAAFTTFWVPVANERYTQNPQDTEFFTRMNKIITCFMLLIAIFLIAFKDIIVLILGQKYREAMFIFPYLVFMPIMYTISETTVIGITFKKKTKSHIIIAVLAAVCNIIGNIILVPSLGATGAAVSTGIAYMVFFIARTYISQKYYKVNYNLKRFAICILMTYVFATYSSFNTFNPIILIMTLVTIGVVIISYIDVFREAYSIIKEFFKRRNIN